MNSASFHNQKPPILTFVIQPLYLVNRLSQAVVQRVKLAGVGR